MTPELREALTALYAAARTDEHGNWWPIRAWMDTQGLFNDDIQDYQRLSELVLQYLLREPEAKP